MGGHQKIKQAIIGTFLFIFCMNVNISRKTNVFRTIFIFLNKSLLFDFSANNIRPSLEIREGLTKIRSSSHPSQPGRWIYKRYSFLGDDCINCWRTRPLGAHYSLFIPTTFIFHKYLFESFPLISRSAFSSLKFW